MTNQRGGEEKAVVDSYIPVKNPARDGANQFGN